LNFADLVVVSKDYGIAFAFERDDFRGKVHSV
jgi:hypothetical protein